ncbi:hypothetical protein IFM89_011884 [Coptis chinensis]|uniref:Uncharacterized protein n=1 Tax=Coptis chinensis TaxID=261450 RepID=A0A835M301_9MAGN|nr:hypothetical protein IFM89_011884 [Coptis chinensis]
MASPRFSRSSTSSRSRKTLNHRPSEVPGRDLRILDPILSYPSTVLGREKAIVINLEHIKAIITAHEVLLLNSKDPSVTLFGDELQCRLLHFHHATTTNHESRLSSGDDVDSTNLYYSEERPVRLDHSPSQTSGFPQTQQTEVVVKLDGKNGIENKDGPKLENSYSLLAGEYVKDAS